MNEITTILTIVFAVAFLAILFVGFFSESEVVGEHEAGLLFRYGKFVRQLNAGRQRIWGLGYEVLRFDTRWCELQVAGQEMLTADRATVRLTAVAVYRLSDARRFRQVAEDARALLYTAIQLALRDLAGSMELAALIERKSELGGALSKQTLAAADELGVELREVSLRDLSLSGDLKRAYAAVIQAREESKASVERARGESASIRTLANAARSFENNPHLLQLRFVQMLEDKGLGEGATLVLGDPSEWMTKNT